MKIGSVSLESRVAMAPMAGMTDTAFRRLVKRQGGCGLVVTEMVSSEGLVRGIDRTLEFAEYTEEERPVSIQIFGGDPVKMADAAQIVEGNALDPGRLAGYRHVKSKRALDLGCAEKTFLSHFFQLLRLNGAVHFRSGLFDGGNTGNLRAWNAHFNGQGNRILQDAHFVFKGRIDVDPRIGDQEQFVIGRDFKNRDATD